MINPDAKVGLFTRIWDWLTYRPWTDDEIAERVARSVANAHHKSWHPPEEHAGPTPVSHLRHSFTELPDDEKETH